MKKCSKCGAKIEDKATFCATCGSIQEVMEIEVVEERKKKYNYIGITATVVIALIFVGMARSTLFNKGVTDEKTNISTTPTVEIERKDTTEKRATEDTGYKYKEALTDKEIDDATQIAVEYYENKSMELIKMELADNDSQVYSVAYKPGYNIIFMVRTDRETDVDHFVRHIRLTRETLDSQWVVDSEGK